MQPVAGGQVEIVDDQMCVRNPTLIVVVVHDDDLEVAEEPHGPRPRKLAQDRQVDAAVDRVCHHGRLLSARGASRAAHALMSGKGEGADG